MPDISKARAKEIYDMVAENRKIKKLLGDTKLENYFGRVEEYLYPQKAKDKNIEPDAATQNMLDLIGRFKKIARDLQAGSTDAVKNGLTGYEAMDMANSLEQIFSSSPTPEEIVASYMQAHGDKHLASEEIQFMSALTGAMHGITDVIDHEFTSEGLDLRKEFFDEIDKNYADVVKSMRNGENAAVKLKFKIDVSDDGLAEFKNQVEADSKKLDQDETELAAALADAKENTKNIPHKNRYEALKSEVHHADREKEIHKSNLEDLKKILDAAKEYEAAEMEKLKSEYDSLIKQHQQAKEEKEALFARTDKRVNEIDKRLAELAKNEEIIKSDNRDLEHEMSEVNQISADLLEMTTGLERLKEQLSDPEKVELIRYAFDNYGEDAVREQMEGKKPEEIFSSDSEMQKYLLAKDSLLRGFPEDEEYEELEEQDGPVKTTKDKFDDLEFRHFTDEDMKKIREEIFEGSVPEKQKAMQEKLDELKKSAEIQKEKEKEDLKREKNEILRERHTAREKFDKLEYKLIEFGWEHENMCNAICSQLGIRDKKEKEEYSSPDKWNDLTERLNKKYTEEKAAYEACSERVKTGEAALEMEKELFEEVKGKIEKHTAEENELGIKLQNVAEKKNKIFEKKKAYNDIFLTKQRIKDSIKDASAMEENLCRNAEETFSGHFAAERISAQLAKLENALSVKKKLGSNSEEYNQLKTALQTARNVFSGRDENWQSKTPAQRKARQTEVLEQLGQKASHYLGEKEKHPHIWPFASTSGFKRRAAAEDILSYSKSAADIVNKTKDLEFDITDRIASCKDAEGNWKENRAEEIIAAKQAEFSRNIENGIKNKNIGAQKEEKSVINNEPVIEERVLGKI